MAKPSAPTGFKWERVGDRHPKFTWNKVAGATSYGIRYLKGSQSGPFTPWVSGIRGTSFTVSPSGNGFSGDAGLRFVVYAENRDGTSQYSAVTPTFYLPAPPPTNVRAKLVLAGAGRRIELGWRTTSYYQSGVEIQCWPVDSANPMPPVLLGTGVGGRVAPSYVDLTPSVGELRYRLRYFAGAETPLGSRVFGTWSAWSNVVSVDFAPPLAPTVPVPVGAAFGFPARVSWVHNSQDATAQTLAEVRYRRRGDSEWLLHEVDSSGDPDDWDAWDGENYATELTGLAVGDFEVQVRTAGASRVFGDWSPVVMLWVRSRPVVTITEPGSVFAGGRVTVGWSVSQAEGHPQSVWTVVLREGDRVVAQRSGFGATSSVPVPFDLVNETDYTVDVVVSCFDVESAPASRVFRVVFDRPAPPALDVGWDESQGSHQITVGPGDGEEPTVSLEVFRSVDQGITWHSLGDYTQGGLFFDYDGLSAGTTHYKAEAKTSLGALATTETSIETRSNAIWIQTDTRSIGLKYGLEWSLPATPAHTELVYFDGDTTPTLIQDKPVSMEREGTIQALLSPWWIERDEVDDETREALADLLAAGGLVTLRLPSGERMEGTLTSLTPSDNYARLTQISLAFKEAKTWGD